MGHKRDTEEDRDGERSLQRTRGDTETRGRRRRGDGSTERRGQSGDGEGSTERRGRRRRGDIDRYRDRGEAWACDGDGSTETGGATDPRSTDPRRGAAQRTHGSTERGGATERDGSTERRAVERRAGEWRLEIRVRVSGKRNAAGGEGGWGLGQRMWACGARVGFKLLGGVACVSAYAA